MRITFEATDMTDQELAELTRIARTSATFEEAAIRIRACPADLWTYEGGSHLAVHRRDTVTKVPEDKRIAIITAEQDASQEAA